jgi:NADH:ubiquinone oxidoreductase subunit 5 (subunit L)/multisubunit Na+/H+ antiporter MnhA subunit
MPHTFWTFIVGTLALAGFPLTAGFFSKDEILIAGEIWAGQGMFTGSWCTGSGWPRPSSRPSTWRVPAS